MNLKFINYIKENPLLKVTSLNSGAILMKMMAGLVISKLTAYFLGPVGIALIGNLRNGQNLINTIASSGIQKGVVSHIAKGKDKKKLLQILTNTFFSLGLLVSIVVGVFIFAFNDEVSHYIFKTNSYAWIITLLAISLPINTLNLFILSILQGLSDFKKVIYINIITSIFNLVLFSILLFFLGLEGAFVTVILLSSLQFIITLFYARPYYYLFENLKLFYFPKKIIFSLSKYGLMTLISSISFPLVYLGVRREIMLTLSTTDAGYWEAMSRLSSHYILLMVSVINLYVLPKLSAANHTKTFKETVLEFYKLIIPFYAVGLVVIYVFRNFIIRAVYSEEFLPVQDLFLGQLIGDFFYILALVMVYQMHAKRQVKRFIATDLFIAIGFYASSVYFLGILGLEGVVYAHALINFLYFLLVLTIFRKPLFSHSKL
ncbi:MAG: O-antigen translocase [Mesonia sp.]|uniref:O-antigen translocase n=1 Tax=Mesonia sp. TaxID=1960830 RepID=UPI003F9AFDA6